MLQPSETTLDWTLALTPLSSLAHMQMQVHLDVDLVQALSVLALAAGQPTLKIGGMVNLCVCRLLSMRKL